VRPSPSIPPVCTASDASPPLAGRRALFVSWISYHGRSADLAGVLGATSAFIAVGRLTNRRTAPVRHLWQAIRTAMLLCRLRPRVLIVMAPPAGLVALALVWRRLTRCKLVVDCHSGAVLGRPLSARLAARADLALVTLRELSGDLPNAVAVHDAPAEAVDAPRHDEIVFPASWYVDEPIAELLAAARTLGHLRFAVTGRPPAGLSVPPNVRLTGFLAREEYLRLVGGAPLVLALTSRDLTMQRAAYEAVAAGRPVVASDTQALRSYLGDSAVYAGDLAAAVDEAVSRLPELERAVVRVREEQRAAFAEALTSITAAVA
jgi:hypothetical protein